MVSMQSLCAEAGTPYFTAAIGDDIPPFKTYLQRTLTEPFIWDIRHAHVYCGLLKNVHVFGHSFILTDTGKWAFRGQCFQDRDPDFYKQSIATFIEPRRNTLFQNYIEEEGIYFGGAIGAVPPVGPNFGNLSYEFLTRLAVFDMFGLLNRLPIFVHDLLPERWMEFFTLVGVSKSQIVRIPAFNTPAFRKVWVASCPNGRDRNNDIRAWSQGFHWLRHRLYAGIGGPRTHERRRIYVGRQGAPLRKITNEDQVVALLESFGFVCPVFEKMSVKEQIELISGAELVVAAEGAGGAIIHYAPDHCISIAISQREMPTTWSGLVTSMLFGQIYESVLCTKSGPIHDLYRDFEIDLDKLKHKVEEALKLIAVGIPAAQDV